MANIYGNPLTLGTGLIGSKMPGMFFQVQLPPSVYYETASKWVDTTVEQPQGISHQMMVNGKLWVFPGKGTAYALDPASGEIVDQFTDPLLTFRVGSVRDEDTTSCTDGERRVWVSVPKRNMNTNPKSISMNLIQIDVTTKTVTDLGEIANSTFNLGNVYNDTKEYFTALPMVYSKFHNGIFVFGAHTCGRTDDNTTSNRYYYVYNAHSGAKFYDLSLNSVKAISSPPKHNAYGFAYEDTSTGEIYIGGGYPISARKNSSEIQNPGYTIDDSPSKTIYKFNLTSNTYTTIKTDFEPQAKQNPINRGGWFTLGDTVLLLNNNVCLPFDPKTGETRPGAVPENPVDIVYPYYSGVYQNTLYFSTNEKFKKCALYENLPEDAPIVAKIYKGNKYHSTVPFEIPGKLNVTTKQQVAEQDIEIKMYEYDAAGGQTLYIESGSEK